MNREYITNCWQHQTIDTTMDVEEQLAEAIKRARRFQTTLFWRNVREVAASILVAGVFAYAALSQPTVAIFGSLFAAAMALSVGAFFLLDRLGRRSKTNRDVGSAKAELERSLEETVHQIRLLRNVAWWYLGPLALGALVFVVAVAVAAPVPAPVALVLVAAASVIIALVDFTIYKLNQRVVNAQLLPQRDEIVRLLDQWREETPEVE